jgi:immune inhibitor A
VKRFRVALALALIGLLAMAQSAVGASSTPKALKLSRPSYAQLDKELVQEAAANGQKLKGKEVQYNPGKSYKSPIKNGKLERLDVRGHGTRGLAILVDWPVTGGGASDVPGVNYPPLPQYLFNDLVNGDTYNPYTLPMFADLATFNGQPAPTDRTMKNYYNEVSYGQFSMTVDMVGWVTMPKPYEYYLGQKQGFYNDNGDAMMGELVKDALAAADAVGVDFTQYAVLAKPGDFSDLYGNATAFTTSDGQTVNMIVPNLFIIHRGTGAEYSRDPRIIWSHKWDILSAGYWGHYYRTGTEPDVNAMEYTVHDGVAINTYNIVPEVGQDITGFLFPGRAPSPPHVGVFAHEFGHVLGLPDLYDYGYDSEGVGVFSLMAGGSYGRSIQNRNYSGNSPVHIDGWGKHYLGFVDFKEIHPSTERRSITLRPVTQHPDIYRVNIPGSNGTEYFVLENRQMEGFDKGLAYTLDPNPAGMHGLVVYQVDENVLIRNFSRPNEAQNPDLNKRGANVQNKSANGENHYAVSVLQADGLFELERYIDDGDPGDFFPGATNAVTLRGSSKSAPNTLAWNQWRPGNAETGIALENIVEHADGTITLDVVYR